jgi:hypothetical protein
VPGATKTSQVAMDGQPLAELLLLLLALLKLVIVSQAFLFQWLYIKCSYILLLFLFFGAQQ